MIYYKKHNVISFIKFINLIESIPLAKSYRKKKSKFDKCINIRMKKQNFYLPKQQSLLLLIWSALPCFMHMKRKCFVSWVFRNLTFFLIYLKTKSMTPTADVIT